MKEMVGWLTYFMIWATDIPLLDAIPAQVSPEVGIIPPLRSVIISGNAGPGGLTR
jgi:hypothetical protein